MRVVFMGSPEFAVPTLKLLLDVHDVACVVTQPDKPAGRGQKLEPPPVKVVAEEAGIPIWQPKSLKNPEAVEELRRLAPDVCVVVAYGKILPQAILDVPRHGCLNVHASLLPAYRGAAPIQWAIVKGETETGVTIMRLDAGMDTGPMLLSRKLSIAEDDTAGTLSPRLAAAGAELMRIALERLEGGALPETPQDHERASMAPKMTKEHGRVDWSKAAAEIRNLARGVDPWPGAWTELEGEPLKLWKPKLVEGAGDPGTVLGVDRDGLLIACGQGAVAFAEAQLPGRKRLPMAALVAGRPIARGTTLR